MSQHHQGRYSRNRRQRRSIKARVISRDEWVCQLCFTAINPNETPTEDYSLTMDHIIEASDGGPFSVDNLRAAHRVCNMARSAA